MIRKIICIDEERCDGCGLCARACHEGAIDIVNGKARLTREHYCDGFGDCLPNCPNGAITFVEREAPQYDEAAVKAAKKKKEIADKMKKIHSGFTADAATVGSSSYSAAESSVPATDSLLNNWPVQLKLAPMESAAFAGKKLLISADCAAYACGDFHMRFIKDHAVVIGCPKLDGVDYAEKLGEIIDRNDIKSITVVRMEVPCCRALEIAARRALKATGKQLSVDVVTLSVDGKILSSTN